MHVKFSVNNHRSILLYSSGSVGMSLYGPNYYWNVDVYYTITCMVCRQHIYKLSVGTSETINMDVYKVLSIVYSNNSASKQ